MQFQETLMLKLPEGNTASNPDAVSNTVRVKVPRLDCESYPGCGFSN
jgi:hypothetical protein